MDISMDLILFLDFFFSVFTYVEERIQQQRWFLQGIFSINTSVTFMVERIIPELKQFLFLTNGISIFILYA